MAGVAGVESLARPRPTDDPGAVRLLLEADRGWYPRNVGSVVPLPSPSAPRTTTILSSIPTLHHCPQFQERLATEGDLSSRP